MITCVHEFKKVYDILWFIPTIKQTNHDKTELSMSYHFIFIVVKSCFYRSLHCLSFDSRLLTPSLVSSIFSLINQSQRFKIRVTVVNAIFNSTSAISRWSVLLVVDTGVPGENHLLTNLITQCCMYYTSP
jgi:hypothetical protein